MKANTFGWEFYTMAVCVAAPPALQSRFDRTPPVFATPVSLARQRRRGPSRGGHLLATVTHELRNPLASLRLSLEMLVADFDDLEPAAAMRLIQRAQRSSRWLQALTENLTSAACIEAGRLETRLEPVDLLTCLHEASGLVDALLRDRQQSLRITCSAPSSLAIADGDRTIQVVANLLANASRYSVVGDEIELHVAAIGQHLRVGVTDHGPGISAADQDTIFDAWVRGADSPSGGLGLGLSIVQTLVHQQGGRVGVESVVGHGATFWFTLPAASPSDTADARPPCTP